MCIRALFFKKSGISAVSFTQEGSQVQSEAGHIFTNLPACLNMYITIALFINVCISLTLIHTPQMHGTALVQGESRKEAPL